MPDTRQPINFYAETQVCRVTSADIRVVLNALDVEFFRRRMLINYTAGMEIVPYGRKRRTETVLVQPARRGKRYRMGYNYKSSAALAARMRARRGAPRGMRRAGYFASQSYERKYTDTAVAAYELDTTGSVTLISVIPQGASQSQRIGRKVENKSIEVRGQVNTKTTTTITSGRVMLVYDRQPNKALAAVTDVLESASYYAFKKDENKNRFLILKDKHFKTTGNQTAAQINDSGIQNVHWFLKLPRGLITEYSTAGTGVIGDITTGALLLVVIGTTAAGTAAMQAQLAFRVRFDDK